MNKLWLLLGPIGLIPYLLSKRHKSEVEKSPTNDPASQQQAKEIVYGLTNQLAKPLLNEPDPLENSMENWNGEQPPIVEEEKKEPDAPNAEKPKIEVSDTGFKFSDDGKSISSGAVAFTMSDGTKPTAEEEADIESRLQKANENLQKDFCSKNEGFAYKEGVGIQKIGPDGQPVALSAEDKANFKEFYDANKQAAADAAFADSKFQVDKMPDLPATFSPPEPNKDAAENLSTAPEKGQTEKAPYQTAEEVKALHSEPDEIMGALPTEEEKAKWAEGPAPAETKSDNEIVYGSLGNMGGQEYDSKANDAKADERASLSNPEAHAAAQVVNKTANGSSPAVATDMADLKEQGNAVNAVNNKSNTNEMRNDQAPVPGG